MRGLCAVVPSFANGFFPWSLGAIAPPPFPSIKQDFCEWLVPVAEEAKARRWRGSPTFVGDMIIYKGG